MPRSPAFTTSRICCWYAHLRESVCFWFCCVCFFFRECVLFVGTPSVTLALSVCHICHVCTCLLCTQTFTTSRLCCWYAHLRHVWHVCQVCTCLLYTQTFIMFRTCSRSSCTRHLCPRMHRLFVVTYAHSIPMSRMHKLVVKTSYVHTSSKNVVCAAGMRTCVTYVMSVTYARAILCLVHAAGKNQYMHTCFEQTD